MAHKRFTAAACVLPSGRVAELGGAGADDVSRKDDGEVFDPVKREWEPLPAEMAHFHSNKSAVAVSGGLLVVSVDKDNALNELHNEGSGRWFQLPHAMSVPRASTGLVSVPAAALTAQQQNSVESAAGFQSQEAFTMLVPVKKKKQWRRHHSGVTAEELDWPGAPSAAVAAGSSAAAMSQGSQQEVASD